MLLFQSARLGGLRLRNRLVMPPMSTYYADAQGRPTDKLREFYAVRSRGGVGSIMMEIHAVEARGRSNAQQLGLWDDLQVDMLRPLVRDIRAGGAALFVQLGHSGRQTTRAATGTQAVAPSEGVVCERYPVPPRALARAEIAEVVDAYGRAAARALAAGYDGIEIHAAHGFLIGQFLSRFANRREDEYGGALHNRMRFGIDVARAVRASVGPQVPVVVRLSAIEGIADGITLEESCAFAFALAGAGVDAIDVSAGIVANRRLYCAPAAIEHGHLVPYARAIRAAAGIPVIVAGRITTPALAEAVLRAGDADFIAMGRALIADPDMPAKAARGDAAAIRPCVGCHQGCRSHPITCMVNPALGREAAGDLQPSNARRRVTVVGAGPAGLEAARVAAARDHAVTLFERSDQVGGQLLLGSYPPYKSEMGGYLAFQERCLRDLGVKLLLSTPASRQRVIDEAPDVVVIASGSHPVGPDVPYSRPVVTAHEVLQGLCTVSGRVVIVGAGETGCETAELLALQGAAVTMVEMEETIAYDLEPDPRYYLLERLARLKVTIAAGARLTEVTTCGVRVRTAAGALEDIAADHVVVATGLVADSAVVHELAGVCGDIRVIGDARRVGNAKSAIMDGYLVAAAL